MRDTQTKQGQGERCYKRRNARTSRSSHYEEIWKWTKHFLLIAETMAMKGGNKGEIKGDTAMWPGERKRTPEDGTG